jgi:hypothetical protein
MVERKELQILTADECRTLLLVIAEKYGKDLKRVEFADVLLALLEDVSGFETISPKEASRIVQHLWSTYHGKEDRQA